VNAVDPVARHRTSGRLIASRYIDPDCIYWRNQQKTPAKSRGKSVTHVATHLSPMTRLITIVSGSRSQLSVKVQ